MGEGMMRCFFLLPFFSFPFLYLKIGGRQIGLFIYTLRQVTSGEELRYSYNMPTRLGSSNTWIPSPPGFCSIPEIVEFMADVKLERVEKLALESVLSCLELTLLKVPGRHILVPWNDCQKVQKLGNDEDLSRVRDLLWMFTVCFIMFSHSVP